MTLNDLRVHPKEDKWVVPKEIITKLGEFDLDVFAPFNRPWDSAKKHFTIIDDGLKKPWQGRVFCNPPDGRLTSLWLEKCTNYGNCIAMVYAKTDTSYYQNIIMKNAYAILYIKGRVKFHYNDGTQADSAPLPSILVAFDSKNANALENCGIKGSFIRLKNS